MHGPSEGDDEISFSEFVDMIQNLTVRTVRDCVGALKILILYRTTRTQNFCAQWEVRSFEMLLISVCLERSYIDWSIWDVVMGTLSL